MSFRLPSGDDKDKPLTECALSSLKYWHKRIANNIAQHKAFPGDEALYNAIKAEIERRRQEDMDAPRPSLADNLALPADWERLIQGFHRQPNDIAKWLDVAYQCCNLIAPGLTCGLLPGGWALAFKFVPIDLRDTRVGGEIYPIQGGMFGINASGIQRIGIAAGVSWLVSQRVDDGEDPRKIHWEAVGVCEDFDGEELRLPGNVELDMNDDSDQVWAIKDRATAEGAAIQIRDTRLFLMRHAETKAMTKAIKRLGLKPKYSKADLDKPFMVVKRVFTGASEDKALEREMTLMIARRHLYGKNALYGPPPELPERTVINADGEPVPASGVPQLPEQTARSAAQTLGLADKTEEPAKKPAAQVVNDGDLY